MFRLPTQTFFNLSEEKRNRLIYAATEEFSEKSLNQASINMIIKKASVSRGSFYQYFENKEDLFFYIMKLVKTDSERLFIDEIKKADGDLFTGVRKYFPKLLSSVMETPNANFFKQLFLHLDYRTSKEVTPEQLRENEEGNATRKAVFSHVDRNRLKAGTDEELLCLVSFIVSMMMQEIVEGYAKERSRKEIHSYFCQKLNWLEHGARKEIKSEAEEK